jgi:uncharacterized surface protein with fasciclin (FAS1) repeats
MVLAVAALVLVGCDNGMANWWGPKDIVETAQSKDDFSTLAAAIEAADLAEALKAEGPYTVFAPNNKAFEKLPEGTLESLLKPENKAQLQSILKYHVVSGKVMARDVTAGKVKTLQGKQINISIHDGTVMVNDATVIQTDVAASNGVIHVIDKVLTP